MEMKKMPSFPLETRMRSLVRLAPSYKSFCVFETVAINGVGCGTLVWQDQLASACPYPGLYEFWFAPPIPLSSTEHLMCYMIAGWLGILQAVVNFDDAVPRRTKLTALYAFACCDLLWIGLMVHYFAIFSIYHIVGSVFTIYRRAKYWIPNGEAPFLEEDEST